MRISAFPLIFMQTLFSHIRTKRIWVGSISLLGSTGVTLLVRVLMAGILARYFSPEEFGMWAILMSLNRILLNGFDFGFGNALRNKSAIDPATAGADADFAGGKEF